MARKGQLQNGVMQQGRDVLFEIDLTCKESVNKWDSQISRGSYIMESRPGKQVHDSMSNSSYHCGK